MSTRTLLLLVAVTALVAGAAGAVLATHQFSDVPADHPFGDEIQAIADAGITTGYRDGTFRPTTDVSRQAMAAFLQRGLGRVGTRSGVATLPGGGDSEGLLATTTLAPGATGTDTTGFALTTAAVTFTTDDVTACPCEVFAWVRRASDDAVVAYPNRATLPAVTTGTTSATVATTGVAAIPGDASEDYELIIGTTDTDVDSLDVEGDLTALYVPFGPAGTGTLDPRGG